MKLIPSEGTALAVNGKVVEQFIDGSKFQYELSDILLNDHRNILSSWLIGNNAQTEGTDIRSILKQLKKPMMTGDPNNKVPLNRKVTLFYVNDRLLEKQ